MNNDADRPLTFQERQQLFNAQLNLGAPKNGPAPRRSPRLPPRNSIHNGSSPARSELAASPAPPASPIPSPVPVLPPRRSICEDASPFPGPAASPIPSPVLPPRRSICEDTSPLPAPVKRNSVVEDTPPGLPPRKSSICPEPGSEVCEEPRVHVSQRKNTRRAVRVKKSPTIKRERGSASDRSPSPCSDPLNRGSPSTIRRVPNRSAPDPPSPKSETLKKSPSTIRRAPSAPSGAPPPITTPPPKSPNTVRRVRRTSPSPACHRQSLPASYMVPELPTRRRSYDERLEVDARAVQSKMQGYCSSYSYARPNGPPPPKPSNLNPYTVQRPPQSMTMKKARALKSSAIYKIDEPPEVNISTHPRFRDVSPSTNSSRHSSRQSSPSVSPAAFRRGNVPKAVPRSAPPPPPNPLGKDGWALPTIIPGGVPPPIPTSLPPPLHSSSEPASRTRSLTGEEQLGLCDDQSDYEDDDDIYGQIAADLDDISYDQDDFIVVQKEATPAPQQAAKSGFREYWHERKEVIESGILEGDQISKDERARQEAMYEVLTSEQTYKKSLETLEKQFINDNLFTCYLDEFPDGPDSILSNIHEIISINKRMLEEFKSLYEGKVTVDSITDIIKSFVDHQFSSYVTYCANTSDQQYALSQRRLEDPDFDMFLTGREKVLAGQNLQSYLLLPMQRITRMPLLLGAIRKKTDDNSPDKAPLEALYNDVTTIVNKCNEGVRRAETRRHMGDLEKKCDFTKIKKQLTSFTDKADRLIVREDLVYILKFKSGKMMGSKINMWLFTDCLVIGLTDPKNESKTMLTEYSPRQLIKVSPHFFPPSSYKKKLEPDRIFHLQLLSPDKKFIIQCQSANDKTNWLEALKKKQVENEDETIYEEWDVPLVQARHHYEKINDDDLELTEGEICRVLKKYTDGWCFGQRESDGEQGWFPMSFMVEIDSDHARYREIIKKQQLLDIVANDKKAAAFFSTMNKESDERLMR